MWQFEAYGFIPNGTSGVSIMQIHGENSPVITVLTLRVYNGTLMNYEQTAIEPEIYDRWIKYNVIHDADAKRLTVFLDGVKKLEYVDHQGPSKFYFKCGVYAGNIHQASYYMESRWRNITVLKK